MNTQCLRTKHILILMFATLVMALYQNCTSAKQFGSNNQSGATGGGNDGMIFQSYALCANGQVGLASVITVSSDLQTAAIIRQNCQNLIQPQPVAMASLQFKNANSSVLLLNGQIFDQQVTGNQNVTVEFCQTADSVQTQIWQNATGLYGTVNLQGGSTTGALIAQTIPGLSLHYASASGQPSQFDLTVASSSATLIYSIAGSASTTLPGLICSSQPTPPPALTPPSGYTANQLIFEDRFLSSSLDTSKWIPQFANQNGVVDTSVPTPYSANPVGGYDAEFFDPGHIATGAGLAITATTDTSIAGYNWRSGCITTHGLFSFTGGYAQFRVKSPDSSSGMWAVIYFLEGGGEIDLQGSGNIGTATPSPNPNQTMVSSVNPDGSNSTLVDTGTDLSAAYHVYGMEYIPGVSVKTYLDGNLIAQFTQNIPTGAFTIVIGLQVAQSQASPWHTIYSPATPSPSEFDISDAQVYSLP